jgi:hypothetical protein
LYYSEKDKELKMVKNNLFMKGFAVMLITLYIGAGVITVIGSVSYETKTIMTKEDSSISTVNPLPLWKKTIPFIITATVYNDTGVENVTLWYRYSINGTEWTNWTSYGTDEEEPWQWEFTGIDGYYEFYSIAIDIYGNVEDPPGVADASTGIDTTKPVTNYILDGIMGDYGWYVSDVVVTLSAIDNLSGVDSTWYIIDSGVWKLYTAPFMVSSDGNHTVYYRSLDKAGNTEDTKSVDFKIDQISPVTIHEFNGILGAEGWASNVTITLIAEDITTGVNYTMYKLFPGEWTIYVEPFVVTEDGNYTLYYYSVDFAGNIEPTNEIEFKIKHDVLPPETTHEFEGDVGDNYWYTSTVVVMLTAEDDSAGVDFTLYKLDAGDWTMYTGAFLVTEDGEYTLYYYSVDCVGNEEEVNEVVLKIDQTSPEINLAVEKTGSMKWRLTANVNDETSGIAKVEFYLDDEYLGEAIEAPYVWECTQKGTAQAIVYDNAGNEAVSIEVPISKSIPQSQIIILTSVSVFSKDTIQGQSISSNLQRLIILQWNS